MNEDAALIRRCIPRLWQQAISAGLTEEQAVARLQWWSPPVLSGGCPNCGDGDFVEVHAYSSAGPISRVRLSCGANDRPPNLMQFRVWRGGPEYMAQPGWTPGDADFLDGPAFVAADEPPYVTIWCGPPAPFPAVPSPQDILTSAGLAYLWLGEGDGD